MLILIFLVTYELVTLLLNPSKSFENAHTIKPNPTPNHSVAKRISKVAAAAVPASNPRRRISIPLMDASAAPNPPGSAETAPTTVEKERMKIAMAAVSIAGGTPRPSRII